jgi:hypothetical protein
MVLAAAGGLGAWLLAEWLLGMAGAPMEVEIPVSLLAMGAGYFGVHIATLRLKPREDDTGLRL